MKTNTAMRIIITGFLTLVFPLSNITIAGPGDDPKEVTIKNASNLIEISGTVWSKNEYGRNKAPLKGCLITLYDEQYNYILSMNTGKEGSYSLTLDPGVSYVVILKKEGFLTRRMKITTMDDRMLVGGIEEINITLTPVAYSDPFAISN